MKHPLGVIPREARRADSSLREAAISAAFTRTETAVSQKGIIFANYQRAGEVTTGNLGA